MQLRAVLLPQVAQLHGPLVTRSRLAVERQFCISLNRLLSYEASKLLSLKEFELLSNQLKR